ncbi:MAG: MFS transporter [Gammaproteobacteria bacterium]|nr:MFS transporter [Gammaproteobacteria bacterium]
MAVRQEERVPALLAFAFIFILMAAYYVLRPVRDALASDWSDAEVSLLWTVNFTLCIAVVATYGYVVSRVRLRYVVPGLYVCFAASFFGFHLLASGVAQAPLADKAFYVWVSVFSLFHVSVFWSFMADVFDREQARRLFPLIAAGASAGALAGPLVPMLLGESLPASTLMLAAALMLCLPLPLAIALGRRRRAPSQDGLELDAEARLGGHPLRGFSLLITHPRLLGIALFLLLFTMVNAFFYFEQKNLLADYELATRTRLLGTVDWLTNLLTFLLAFFATSRLLGRLGMGATLALLPALAAGGLLCLALAPAALLLLALQVCRRAGEYAITRPAREMLFTQVDRETRFKAKPVIDTVVYRGGDTLTGWAFSGLSHGLGLGLGALAAVGVFISVLWAVVGYRLGRAFDEGVP